MSDDRTYMRRALDLAKQAEGFASPNPMVGCVIVRDGVVVGEGFHARPGAPHAEAAALAAAGEAARGATMYVTLEPCSHYGRTPPCTDAILDAGVTEVVFAAADPNPLACGGASTLEAAGVRARGGVCEDEARDLNRFFFAGLYLDRPYVIAKFAASLDGKIATRSGDSKWITGPEARLRAHDLRQAVDAILVGAQTVIADDPSLTARPEGRTAAHPLRIVLDSRGRTPISARIFDPARPGATIVASAETPTPLRRAALEARGVETIVAGASDAGRVNLPSLLHALKERGVQSLMVEGGGETLGAFFDAGLVDEVWAFLAPIVIGGAAPSPIAGAGPEKLGEALRLMKPSFEHLGDDILLRGTLSVARKEASCLRAS